MELLLFNASLAWRNLLHNKQRFLTALGAIAFAVFLMFIQMGFRNAMLDSGVQFLRYLNADLIMTSQRRYVSFAEQTFNKIRLYQAQGFEGIEATYPLYIGTAIWKNQQTLIERPIRVFGLDLAYLTFLISAVEERANALQFPDTVLADRKSKSGFGTMATGTIAELSDRRVKVIGTFDLGTDFMADGNLITSDQNFSRIFVGRPSGGEGNIRYSLNDVDLGLLKVTKGTNPETMVKLLNKVLPPNVIIMTKREFINRELNYLNQSTPIGFVFALGTAIGFIVGVIIVYDIIYTDIGDNLPQYAMLKAIGYSSLYLRKIIVLESIILAILGFFPGVCLSILVYQIAASATGLLIRMNSGLMVMVFILTFCMCILSGLVATRKIQLIDPAEVYGQKG